ncbi:UNVERIFIED_CONTAM: hypothetical protein FKN15_007031 [Acipenser sinensis]
MNGRDYPGLNNLVKFNGELVSPELNNRVDNTTAESFITLFPFTDAGLFEGLRPHKTLKSCRQRRLEKQNRHQHVTVLVVEQWKGVSMQCSSNEILEETGEEVKNFGQEQAQDPTLIHVRERVVFVNDVPVEGAVINPGEHYIVKNDLLYRVIIVNIVPVE